MHCHGLTSFFLHRYVVDCPADLICALYKVGYVNTSKDARKGFSSGLWPVDGGCDGSETCAYSELIITGHQVITGGNFKSTLKDKNPNFFLGRFYPLLGLLVHLHAIPVQNKDRQVL